MPPTTYRRTLGLFSGVMAVVGGIIGSGIFRNPAIVAQRVGTASLTLTAWIAGGVVALIGAFCYGELGQRMPRAGGTYVYLRDALGPLPAFLYAWSLLLVIATGAMAAVAATFAGYFASLVGLTPSAITPLAIGAILLLTGVNYIGVQFSAATQNLFTVLKLGAIAVLIVVGLTMSPGAPSAAADIAPAGEDMVLALATALVPVLFAYGGWQQTNNVAEEMLEPERDLPRALVIGVIVVVAVYLLVNVTYLRALGAGGLAASTAPAADAMRMGLGEAGARLIAAGIAVSTFGFLNLVMLVSPRVYQTMAADGLFFPSIGRLHPRFQTPAAAILFQSAWAILLLLTGSYGQLLDYVVFCDWIFFGLTVSTLFVYRARDRAAGRDPTPPGRFRVPGFPVLPALFILAAVYVVVGSIKSNPGNALRGVLILAAGGPVFLYWRGRRKAEK